MNLTDRQALYLTDAAEGLEYAEIGRRRYVSRDTVATTLSEARKKLGAVNTTHAVALAIKAGLIDL